LINLKLNTQNLRSNSYIIITYKKTPTCICWSFFWFEFYFQYHYTNIKKGL